MQTIIKGLAIAALAALAITYAAAQGPKPSGACNSVRDVNSRPCAFEQLVWDLVRDSGDESEIESYIRMYPTGRYVDEAKRILVRMMPKYGVLPPRSITS